MKANVGGIDKVLRILVGILVIAAGIFFKNPWGAIGLVPLLTGLFNICPAYSIFGISSCKLKTETN